MHAIVIWIRSRGQSFGHAFRGLRVLISESNARIHAFATLVVIGAGFFAGLSRWEWVAVTLAIGLVWTAEACNTALESLSDALCPDQNALVGIAKNVAATAVLLAAVGAVAVGVLVFWPHCTAWLAVE